MGKNPKLIYVSAETSQIKEVEISYPKIFLTILITIFLSILLLKYSVDFLIEFGQNSKIVQLKKQNELLLAQLEQMSQKIENMRAQIDWLEKTDDELRALLDLPPINEDVRQVGVGGSEVESPSLSTLRDFDFGDKLVASLNLLERLEREVRLESQSYKELLMTMERREDSLKYLPALRPVPNSRVTGHFGNRKHPILKTVRFHRGIDLAAKRGTPVIAPADGYVTFAGYNGGFGKFVAINHKYGFETYYGHLDKIYVRPGQFVKRGDKIGEVGNTGLSTSYHLHYEVHYKGKPLNPENYFLKDVEYF